MDTDYSRLKPSFSPCDGPFKIPPPLRPSRNWTRCPHPVTVITFWKNLLSQMLKHGTGTPIFVFSPHPVEQALKSLRTIEKAVPVPVRHWFPCKAQPLAPLLDWWHRQNRPIEVASEFELMAARKIGFQPDSILLNGPCKTWLNHFEGLHGLRVNIDSENELGAILPLAKELDWSLGVRCLTSEEKDPENPGCPTQFGLEPDNTVNVLRKLMLKGVRLETVHFHLRTNVESAKAYQRAIEQVAHICHAAQFKPKYLDVGGGLPPPWITGRSGDRLDSKMKLSALALVLARAVELFPGLQEIWMENGRFLAARSGVLVTTIRDKKVRNGVQQLICDGGRTLNAMPSVWEKHAIFVLQPRYGKLVQSMVYGPTCMAFDQLGLMMLPSNLRIGDILVWMDAGAYHLQWETHFSHGRAGIWWHENSLVQRIRSNGQFSAWWKNLGG